MKIIIRLTCLVLSLLCVSCFFASCQSNLPEALKDAERGDRIPFDMDTLSSYSCTPDFSGKDGLKICFNTKGFDGADYVNCTIDVTFTCTVLYEDMTEEDIEKSFTVVLGFDGTEDFAEPVPCGKKIHNVYDEEFTIDRVSGSLIKK